ncbi:MAG TPA: prepilin-type N-terminal cleavage/methylation domain-containing protein [Micavibrio sp.]
MSVRFCRGSIAGTKGFSLIEVAIGLVVLGLLIGPALHIYALHVVQKPWNDTSGNAALAMSAVGNFYTNNGRYPCPADRTLPRTDPGYGKEDCALALSAPVGGCTGDRICRATGYDTNGNSTADDNDNVMIGAVPVSTLGLAIKDGLDGYGDKLSFMVTQILTDSTTFDIAKGAVIIKNIEYDASTAEGYDDLGDGVDVIEQSPSPSPQRGGHYAVVSHGADKNGAFSADGVRISNCGALASARDNENCNDDAIITYDRDRDDLSIGNTVAHYDDYALYAASSGSGFWSILPDNADPANPKLNVMNTNIHNVGINNPTPTEALDVIGNIQVKAEPTTLNPAPPPAMAQAAKLCDANGNNCFDPALVGGAEAAMTCPDGQAMTAIAGGAAACASFTVPSTTLPALQNCTGATPYIVGLNPDGTVKCGS